MDRRIIFEPGAGRVPDVQPIFPVVVETEPEQADVLHAPWVVLGMKEDRRDEGSLHRWLHPSSSTAQSDAKHTTVIWWRQVVRVTADRTGPPSAPDDGGQPGLGEGRVEIGHEPCRFDRLHPPRAGERVADV